MNELSCVLPIAAGSLSCVLLACCKDSRKEIVAVTAIALISWVIYMLCVENGDRRSGTATGISARTGNSKKSVNPYKVQDGAAPSGETGEEAPQLQSTQSETNKDLKDANDATKDATKDATNDANAEQPALTLAQVEEKRQEIIFRPSFPSKDASRETLMKSAYMDLQQQNTHFDPHLKPADQKDTCICIDKQRFFRTKVPDELR